MGDMVRATKQLYRALYELAEAQLKNRSPEVPQFSLEGQAHHNGFVRYFGAGTEANNQYLLNADGVTKSASERS
jgi:hypothetical protein